MIRVFPRKTNWTPTDRLAIVGDPHIPFLDQSLPVRISVTFTWDIPEGERLYRSWRRYYDDVELGGPAFDDPGGEFVPGRFLKKGMVITSRGCTKECEWCFVPKREGHIREFPIMDGFNLADNNLLACSPEHVNAVFDMLRCQQELARFSGGLDAEMLAPWHVDLLKSIRLYYAYFAYDFHGALLNLEKVADLMSDFHRNRKRCYVLIGRNGDDVASAEKRLEQCFNMGFLPFAMLYRDKERRKHGKAWRDLQRKWTRPACYSKRLKEGTSFAE